MDFFEKTIGDSTTIVDLIFIFIKIFNDESKIIYLSQLLTPLMNHKIYVNKCKSVVQNTFVKK